ncbi:MAG TPA: TlpA disulfide reductase family protein [Candidatus Desulfaltia sp.]|nr:TlpA disulfide reductase family protein [Candidatus Desulfaltia sp.]
MKPVHLAAITAAALMLIGTSFVSTTSAQDNYASAPNFKLTDINGKMITLSDYKGKVLFLNFWATWCPPCREEIPDFIEAYAEQKANGLEIVGISLDTKGKEAVAAFVEKYKINYPVVLETGRNTEKIINDYQPGQYIPTTIIIDKSGRIRHKEVGAIDKETLLKHFQRLAAE